MSSKQPQTKTSVAYKLLLNKYAVLREYKPLAVDVLQELSDSHPELSRRDLRRSLYFHCRGVRYTAQVMKGGDRYHLDGTAVPDGIEQGHVEHAKEQTEVSLARIKEADKQKQHREKAAKASKRRRNPGAFIGRWCAK